MTESTDTEDTRQQSLYHITTDRELSPRLLIEERGTIPFSGLDKPAAYPKNIDDDTLTEQGRFEPETPHSFASAINVLPQATKVRTYGHNEFAEKDENGDVEVDVEAIKEIDGVDVDEIEAEEDASVEDLVADADPQEVLHIPSKKVVCDKRRKALKNLGYETKFSWKIGSNRYTPLDVRKFFDRKISVLQDNNIHNAFGWVRHRSWGGHVTVTTIYPSVKREIVASDESDVDTGSCEPLGTVDDDDSEDHSESQVAYFGERVRYTFESSAILNIKPVVYFPQDDLMVPMHMMGGDTLSRKQMGSLNEDIRGFHQQAIDQIEDFSKSIDQTIRDARRMSIDFDKCRFTMEQFFEYLGIDNTSYIEETVDRVRSLADPPNNPSIWNLQLSLKKTLLEECNSDKAADTYQHYQEIAGEILQNPEIQLSLVMAEHQRVMARKNNSDEDADQTAVPTISDFDVADIDGVTENDLASEKAEAIQERIDQRLQSFQGGE